MGHDVRVWGKWGVHTGVWGHTFVSVLGKGVGASPRGLMSFVRACGSANACP